LINIILILIDSNIYKAIIRDEFFSLERRNLSDFVKLKICCNAVASLMYNKSIWCNS